MFEKTLRWVSEFDASETTYLESVRGLDFLQTEAEYEGWGD